MADQNNLCAEDAAHPAVSLDWTDADRREQDHLNNLAIEDMTARLKALAMLDSATPSNLKALAQLDSLISVYEQGIITTDTFREKVTILAAPAVPAVDALTDERISGYAMIARLTGITFFAGGFVAETFNERALESLLIKTGHRYTSWEEVESASVLATLSTVPDEQQMMDAAWNAYQNAPVDHAEDSDTETRKCVEVAVRAALAVGSGHVLPPVAAPVSQHGASTIGTGQSFKRDTFWLEAAAEFIETISDAQPEIGNPAIAQELRAMIAKESK